MSNIPLLLFRRTGFTSAHNSRWACSNRFFDPSFKPSVTTSIVLGGKHAWPSPKVASITTKTFPSLATGLGAFTARAALSRLSLSAILHFARTGIRSATHRDLLRSRGGSGSSWRRPPRGDWLDSLDSKVIFYGIIAVNVGIYLAWQSAVTTYRTMGDTTLLVFLRDNFLVDMRNVSAGRLWTLLTACFSHRDTSHALFNGLTFYFMAPAVMQLLGNKRFLGLYFLGGISASLASLAWNRFFRHENVSSHGASGAIMATLAFYSCAFPRNTFLIFFVIPCPAWIFLPGVLLYDGWRSFSDRRTTTDSAGHVGGLLSGVGYYLWKFAVRR
ncbi:rhomboid-domain-containing protein [Paxillus ammoniavirescens]|nr:rhomboid-domain-containing protein [Paxillus ammoniavirescens]